MGEFKDSSYATRYELLCLKMLRERLYDACCFITSDRLTGPKGAYLQPNEELNFDRFLNSLKASASVAFPPKPR